MNLELAGKVALVGGASRGIGLSIAERLLAEGCRLAITARGEEALKEAASKFGSDSLAFRADLRDPGACEKLVTAVEERFGHLDVLVTNAGSGQSLPPGRETPEAWRASLDINLMTAANLIGAARPLLAKGDGGSIVCISSICGGEALGAPVTYSASKAALDAMVKGLSRPFAAESIRINAVAPGNIYFPGGMWERRRNEAPGPVDDMLAREVPMARFGSPQEVADAVAFLASRRAGFITGAVLVVDGGQTRS